ncbi:M48 family metallopeptidase [Pseudomonas sp. MRSN 12121]|uniref:M48 family metallopeptidase n=1 Tax=Pseudomonas sp. MRSN 12121 TaxID=1611770 RepID=UPI000B094D6F|nr:M48 family metallopeptidase [Pseudomonas sp. MRSN 12121]
MTQMPDLRRHRLRISAWLLLGDVTLLTLGALLCLLPALLLVALPGLLGVLAAVAAFPAAPFGLVMLKVPFSSRNQGEEDGIALLPEDVPQLFAELERIRSELGAPGLDAVYLNNLFNASIRQHRVLVGRTRNVLWLGLPLLDTLSPAACAAILAHECAHIAHRHGRYASRVYFARLQWQAVSDRLERNRTLTSAPLRLFVEWYVPRFLDISLDFARQCEYQADAEAARVCGADTFGQALIGLALQHRALAEDYWPTLYAQAATEPRDNLQPLLELARHGLLKTPADAAQARIWLHAELCSTTERSDTHPALAERLAALGIDTARIDLPLHWQRARPSAAQAWLGEQHHALAQHLDQQAAELIRERCNEAREDYQARGSEHHELLRKQRIRSLNSDEIARLAWLYRTHLGDNPRAASLLQEALRQDPEHAALRQQHAFSLYQAADTRGAAQRWQQLADEPGPYQLGSLRQLSMLAMKAQDWERASHYRQQADHLHRQANAEQDPQQYHAHGLAAVEVNKLARTLDPLLRVATGVWLLRQPDSRRYVLLVQARTNILLRVVSRLTGEQNYSQRNCEQLLERLLPRLHLWVEAFILDDHDPRLGQCTEAARMHLDNAPG